MRDVEWTPVAREDLAAIDAYWWAFNRERADEILDRIEAAGGFLSGMPHADMMLEDRPARKWRVRGTSYLLIYRIHDDRIEILRVHHASQDWQESEPD